jgi:hypothetical protein
MIYGGKRKAGKGAKEGIMGNYSIIQWIVFECERLIPPHIVLHAHRSAEGWA